MYRYTLLPIMSDILVVSMMAVLAFIPVTKTEPPRVESRPGKVASAQTVKETVHTPPSTQPQAGPTAESPAHTVPVPAPAAQLSSPPPCVRTPYTFATAVSVAGFSPGFHHISQPSVYYTIYGNTADQIKQQMQQCSPVTHESAVHSAAVSYVFSWQYNLDYQYMRDDGVTMCRIKDVTVGMSTRIVYPQWIAGDQTEPNLQDRWAAYSNALHTHEQGHISINIRYGEQVYTALKSLESTPCDGMAEHVTATVNSITAQLDSASEQYDANTHHGVAQGAKL